MSTRETGKKLYGRRGYPADLKKKVLAHLASNETSLRETSKSFNISVPTLMKWRKESLAGEGSLQSGSSKPASTELERLRAEVEQLRAERDRLRRGIAILVGLEVSD
jgi:transposase-like protein